MRVKRLFDLVFGLIGLIMTGPVLAIIAVLILSANGRPVLFRHHSSKKSAAEGNAAPG